MKKLTDKEVKQIELDILEYVHNFCEENGLKYIMNYGTLIGAVRHKGFIPWDDDIDISMPRADYEKLICIHFQRTDVTRFLITEQVRTTLTTL